MKNEQIMQNNTEHISDTSHLLIFAVWVFTNANQPEPLQLPSVQFNFLKRDYGGRPPLLVLFLNEHHEVIFHETSLRYHNLSKQI